MFDTAPALQRLDLSENSLAGAIPPGVSTHAALTHLLLGDNAFDGTFPTLPRCRQADATDGTSVDFTDSGSFRCPLPENRSAYPWRQRGDGFAGPDGGSSHASRAPRDVRGDAGRRVRGAPRGPSPTHGRDIVPECQRGPSGRAACEVPEGSANADAGGRVRRVRRGVLRRRRGCSRAPSEPGRVAAEGGRGSAGFATRSLSAHTGRRDAKCERRFGPRANACEKCPRVRRVPARARLVRRVRRRELRARRVSSSARSARPARTRKTGKASCDAAPPGLLVTPPALRTRARASRARRTHAGGVRSSECAPCPAGAYAPDAGSVECATC